MNLSFVTSKDIMDEAHRIRTRTDRLDEILSGPYLQAVDEIKNMLYSAIYRKNDNITPKKKEIRKKAIEYLVGNSSSDNPVDVDDISSALENLDRNCLDAVTIKTISDKHRSMIGTIQQRHLNLFIRRDELVKSEYGKRRAVFYLDTDAVSAFNEKYREIVEFAEKYKGDLKLLLLDELSRLN